MALSSQTSDKPLAQVVGSIEEVDARAWDALAEGMPLLSHAFLSALERSSSVGENTGWHPSIITITQHKQLLGAVPLYLKTHSYGEYVFDWTWADAYERSGLSYYPKLLAAIPFSPITSARLLAKDDANKVLLIDALEALMHQHQLSSAHVLFPDETDARLLTEQGWLKRTGVQFRWENAGYESFDDFLKTLQQSKRKKIRQERKKVLQAGVVYRVIKGADATSADWDFFYQCYCNTYREHHSTPYLTRAFFHEIGEQMPQHIVLIMAEVSSEPIASTLNFYDAQTLYGRYWGATQFVSGLHFELCYYQAQQFCIQEGIRYFEGGAQGEHKLARGFKPRPTCSYHQIANPDFRAAIQHFLAREKGGISAYQSELEERAPFKPS